MTSSARSLRGALLLLLVAGCEDPWGERRPPELAVPTPELAVPTPELEAPLAPTTFRFRQEDDALLAIHPVLDMRVAIARDGRLDVGAREGAPLLGLRLVTAFGEPAPDATITHEDGRVVLDRGSVREWYLHDERGLEQGFTVRERPRGGLSLAMTLETDAETVLLDPDTLEVHTASLVVRYAGLVARDADGRELDARLTLEDGLLGIHVDDAGARYPVEIDPLLTVEQKLVAGDAAVNDQFGHAVAIDGDTLVVGAHTDDIGAASNAGSAHVYVRSGGLWSLHQKLAPGVDGDFFGGDVAIDGDTIVVGASSADTTSTGAGAVYVYVRSGTVWSQQARLVASAGGLFDGLGESVAVSGDTILAGAEGSGVGNYAVVFVRSGTTWTEQATLTASDAMTGDWFGYSVALDGNTALVGAFSDDTAAGASAGSAYVFVRSGTTWTEQAHLFASDALAGDELGKAVSLSGDYAFVGAPSDDHGAASLAGSTYVFERTGTVWTQRSKLVPADVTSGDQFGYAVSVSGTMAVVAAPLQERGVMSTVGAVYLYQRVGGVWTPDVTLRASDGVTGDFFGHDVGVQGGNAVVGATLDTHGLLDDAGSAYVYRLVPVGDPCGAPSDCVSGFCVDGVCCDLACAGGPGDCQACSVAAGASRNGFCETLPTTRTCRGASGACDVAETCDGAASTCPADGFAGAGVVCRAAPGACDVAETCTGSSGACPADGFADTTTVCRPSLGPCDVADACTGSSATCPMDALAAPGTGCRAATDLCDAPEACTGSSAACPTDGVSPAGTPCRAAAGMCDVAEACTGSGRACPSDALVGAGTLCRGAADVCDVAERCTGGAAACPIDVLASAGAPCRISAGVCDVAEACTGSAAACPTDGFVAPGTSCRATAGACDVAEACTGSGAACPTDGFVLSGTSCRASAGACDVAESCSGSAAACPADGLAAAGTECRASAGVCDLAETCTGSAAACGPDLLAASSTTCRGARDLCDAEEHCAGAVTCPPDDLVTAGTTCRPSTGACDVAEACTGATDACPADAFVADGTACDDGLVCDGDEACSAGACASSGAPACDDGDPCTADACAEPGGCASSPIPGCCLADADCDDADACTDDTCDLGTNTCATTAITGCCAVDADCDDGDPCTDETCDAMACVVVPRASCDAGVPRDAGSADAAALDGGAFGDAGLPPPTIGGCGCAVPAERSSSRGAWLGLALAAVAGLFRARRRP